MDKNKLRKQKQLIDTENRLCIRGCQRGEGVRGLGVKDEGIKQIKKTS